jgi:hypothetical protein
MVIAVVGSLEDTLRALRKLPLRHPTRFDIEASSRVFGAFLKNAKKIRGGIITRKAAESPQTPSFL